MISPSRSYREQLLKDLKNPLEAVAYLNAALEEDSTELFLLALRNVAEAHGMKKSEPSPENKFPG